MNHYQTALSFVAATLLAGSAMAQGTTPLTQQHADFLDQNRDGAVSPQEYNSYLSNAFRYLDVDGNGSLSRSEVGDLLSDSQFSAIDGNGNGRVSQQELLGQGQKDFATADRDGSGSLR